MRGYKWRTNTNQIHGDFGTTVVVLAGESESGLPDRVISGSESNIQTENCHAQTGGKMMDEKIMRVLIDMTTAFEYCAEFAVDEDQDRMNKAMSSAHEVIYEYLIGMGTLVYD